MKIYQVMCTDATTKRDITLMSYFSEELARELKDILNSHEPAEGGDLYWLHTENVY